MLNNSKIAHECLLASKKQYGYDSAQQQYHQASKFAISLPLLVHFDSHVSHINSVFASLYLYLHICALSPPLLPPTPSCPPIASSACCFLFLASCEYCKQT